ncbi:hypothetical protein PALU110988_05655 [Paenibacillus lupini]|nr:hypothetical protein [Paenibacillus lupini]
MKQERDPSDSEGSLCKMPLDPHTNVRVYNQLESTMQEALKDENRRAVGAYRS